MRKKLYIHIGSHKTGTTAIQHFLSANRKILAADGHCYPGSEYHHHDMVREFRSRSLSDIVNEPDSATQNYFNEFSNSGLNNLILSSEMFENTGMPVDKLKEFLKDRFLIKIIFYIRRQDEKTESAYSEAVKDFQTQYDKPIEELIQILSDPVPEKSLHFPPPEKRLVNSDYYSILEPWSNTFGKENIIIRCYEEQQLPRGIYHDFLDTVGLTLDERYWIPTRRINRSLSQDHTEFFRICNSRFKAEHDFHQFILNNLIRIDSKQETKKHHLLSPEQRRDIISFFEQSNAKIAREYLGRSDGQLFYAPLPDLQEPWEPYEGLTVEKVVPIFVALMHSIDKNVHRMKKENKKNKTSVHNFVSYQYLKNRIKSIFS